MPKLIILDPGHDREEPGATQIDGESEHLFTLKLAAAVSAELTRGYDCRVMLTRMTPEGMVPGTNLAAELKARGELANKLQADFLLSLHHNAGPGSARGGELYIWTNKRRADGSLLWLPAIQEGGEANHTAPRSFGMAKVIQPLLKASLASLGIPWHGPDIACADFAVLRYPDTPCALLETHYGTNPQDDEAADRPEFIPKLAEGIARALGAALELPAKVAVWDPKAEIARLKERGVIDGDHIPSERVTWAQFATMLNRVLDRIEGS